MNIFFSFLIATMLIAGMILLRMFADRRARQARIRGGHPDSDCEQVGCFRGCEPDTATGKNELKRSVHHAH